MSDEIATEVLVQALEAANERVKKAKELLREWRDKYGGRAVHVHTRGTSASPSDVLRETQRFLEGK